MTNYPYLEGCLPVFQIHEFRSSEDYHFHSKKQMELVSVMCPKISKVKKMKTMNDNKDNSINKLNISDEVFLRQ